MDYKVGCEGWCSGLLDWVDGELEEDVGEVLGFGWYKVVQKDFWEIFYLFVWFGICFLIIYCRYDFITLGI